MIIFAKENEAVDLFFCFVLVSTRFATALSKQASPHRIYLRSYLEIAIMTAPMPELVIVGFDEPSDAEPPTSITSWKPTTTSKEAIDKKAKLATLRKQQALASKTAKASKFTKKASATYHLKQAQDEEGIFEATKALETKISSAGSKIGRAHV